MKKYFTILVVMLSMTMVGCDKDETPEEKNDAVKAALVGTWEVEGIKADTYKGTTKVGTDVDLPGEFLEEMPLRVAFTKTQLSLIFEDPEDNESNSYTVNSETGVILLAGDEEGIDELNYTLSSDKKTLTIWFKQDVEEDDDIDSMRITLTLKKTS